jgi:wyosine [tRNA(Phe)-imidazoG37] synthetase (radical SAM superfamily)
LIWLYSFFENKLKEYCDFIEKHSKHKIKVKDFGRRGIERYEKYLRLVNGIDSPLLSKHWSEISKYAAVRNLIVHNNSSLIQNKEKALNEQPNYNIISKNEFLMINDDNETFVIFLHHYLLDFADLLSTYLVELCKEVIDKVPEITD